MAGVGVAAASLVVTGAGALTPSALDCELRALGGSLPNLSVPVLRITFEYLPNSTSGKRASCRPETLSAESLAHPRAVGKQDIRSIVIGNEKFILCSHRNCGDLRSVLEHIKIIKETYGFCTKHKSLEPRNRHLPVLRANNHRQVRLRHTGTHSQRCICS